MGKETRSKKKGTEGKVNPLEAFAKKGGLALQGPGLNELSGDSCYRDFMAKLGRLNPGVEKIINTKANRKARLDENARRLTVLIQENKAGKYFSFGKWCSAYQYEDLSAGVKEVTDFLAGGPETELTKRFVKDFPWALSKAVEVEPAAASPEAKIPVASKPLKVEFNYVTGKFSNLKDSTYLTSWGAAYPAVDIVGELKKAAAWLLSNPKNRKSDLPRFLNNWLQKAQNSAAALGKTGSAKQNGTVDEVCNQAISTGEQFLAVPCESKGATNTGNTIEIVKELRDELEKLINQSFDIARKQFPSEKLVFGGKTSDTREVSKTKEMDAFLIGNLVDHFVRLFQVNNQSTIENTRKLADRIAMLEGELSQAQVSLAEEVGKRKALVSAMDSVLAGANT